MSATTGEDWPTSGTRESDRPRHRATQRCLDRGSAAAGRGELYREASRYADKFCARLERLLARNRAAGSGPDSTVLAELRRFYRLTHARKRALIEGIG